jgi:hypothetical protein
VLKVERENPTRFWAGVFVTVVMSVAAQLYGYGRLNERVDELQYQVREMRAIVMQEHQQRASQRELGEYAK